jgi:PAS domain S-box-containing protein
MNLEAGRSILIVEDERIVARDLQQTLRELGYDAFAIASSSDEAVLRASERCPDLVLMDIRIEGQRDGVETAEILRSQFGVPVIYLTAHADDATLKRAMRSEPHGYLLKPVKTAELRSSIEVSLHKHKMEKRLRERERWFATTLHSIADAVIAVDLAGRVTFMNPPAEALTGTSAASALGRPAREVLQLKDGDGMPYEQTPLATALREKRQVALQEASLVNLATGAQRLIADSAAPVIDAGQTLGAVMVFRDVTEQRSLQKQLEISDRLASLGTMAAGVAHEINNPLAVVLGTTGVLVEEVAKHRAELPPSALSPQATSRLDDIGLALNDVLSAAERISHIVSDLRAFSRPMPPSSGLMNVVGCLEWAIRTTAHELHQRARLIKQFGPIPEVRGDETRLSQVLINLLINAAHAIPSGDAEHHTITISARTDAQGWLVIEVSDTGTGIAKEHIGRIFEPFFTTKPVGVGTGLGLSICHGIVSSLGGQLRVESQPGEGSLFQVRLPAALPEQTPQNNEPAPQTLAPPERQARVLVIDDEDIVLRVIARVLRDQHVVCAHSAQEALSLLDHGQRFDIILADLLMPTMTGMDFYEILLGRDPDLAQRVVFLTGGAVTARARDFLQSVPNLRLDKPFGASALRAIVQHTLGEGASPAA